METNLQACVQYTTEGRPTVNMDCTIPWAVVWTENNREREWNTAFIRLSLLPVFALWLCFLWWVQCGQHLPALSARPTYHTSLCSWTTSQNKPSLPKLARVRYSGITRKRADTTVCHVETQRTFRHEVFQTLDFEGKWMISGHQWTRIRLT